LLSLSFSLSLLFSRFSLSLSLSSTKKKQVVSWLKKPGDKVTKGEAVVVVESDKADMEVESVSL